MLKLAVVILGFSIAITVIKWFSNGPECKSDARIDNKVAIVTGANTGLGKETVLQLALLGGKVYMACRSMQRCNDAATEVREQLVGSGQVIPISLDLSSRRSIENFVQEFRQNEDHLDILINNAAVGTDVHERQETEDGFELVFGVNHLGHFLLTVSMVDLLANGKPSRVVSVSAKAHLFSDIDWDDLMMKNEFNSISAYMRSKTANILFTRTLHNKLSENGITSYSLHPGVIPTEILRNIKILDYPLVGPTYRFLSWPFVKDAYHGVQTTICCAVHESITKDSGKYFSDCDVETTSAQASSDMEADRLWKVSLDFWKLKPEDLNPMLR